MLKNKFFIVTALLITFLLIVTACTPSKVKNEPSKPQTDELSKEVQNITYANQVKADGWLGELKNRKFEPRKLNVGYENRSDVEKLLKVLKYAKVVDEIPELKVVQIDLGPINVEDAYEILKGKKIDGIRYIEPNYIDRELPVKIPDQKVAMQSIKDSVKVLAGEEEEDAYRKFQYGLNLIGAPDIWEEASGTDIIVAVLDTGVDATHPDLQGQVIEQWIWTGSEWVKDTNPNINTDTYGHGTHCAGIIAAKKGGGKVIGVAPNAKIISVRIFTPGYIGEFPVAKGIVLAVNRGAHVLSNSWGGGGYSNLLKDAFDYALENDVVVVASAGNDHTDQSWHYPSGYTGVIGVAASNVRDKVTDFSNRGEYVSVAAPGDYVLAPMAQNKPGYFATANDPYAYWSGTSMAGPHVAGLAALLRQKYPDASAFQIKKIIEKGAKDIESAGFDTAAGFGRIDAKASIALDPSKEKVGTLFVYATDRDGVNIADVYVTIKNKSTGRTYKEKAYIPTSSAFVLEDVGAVAKFYGIELGEYDVFVGGPDFLSRDVPIFRIEEQIAEATTVTLTESEPNKTVSVKLKSKNFGFYLQPTHEPGKDIWEGEIVYNIWRFNRDISDFEIVATATTNDAKPVELDLDMSKRDEKDWPLFVVSYQFTGQATPITIVSEDFEDDKIDLPKAQLLGNVPPAIINTPSWATGNTSTKVLALGDASGQDLEDSQSSEFSFEVELTKDAVLSFKYLVSTEYYWDPFIVYIDDQQFIKDSGQKPWQLIQTKLKAGKHKIRFVYQKDSLFAEGQDSVLIDDITIGEPLGIVGYIKINGQKVKVAVPFETGLYPISDLPTWPGFYLF